MVDAAEFILVGGSLKLCKMKLVDAGKFILVGGSLKLCKMELVDPAKFTLVLSSVKWNWWMPLSSFWSVGALSSVK